MQIKDKINSIINGDCIQVMKEFPDKCIDLVITDPPYNANYGFANDNMSEEDFYKWTEGWIKECERISKGQVYIVTPKYALPFYKIPRNKYFHTYVHYKVNAIRAMDGGYQNTTFIICYGIEKVNYLEDYPNDVWSIPIFGRVGQRHLGDVVGHVTPKPFELYRVIIEKFSNRGDLLLDPFLGSGTLAYVSKRLNRNYIGIEIDKEMCNKVKKALSQSVIEDLFLEDNQNIQVG